MSVAANRVTMKTTDLLLVVSCLLASSAFAQSQVDRIGLRLLVVETEERAASLRDQIESGRSFDSLAREVSLDPSSVAGGYLGELTVVDLREEFQTAVRGRDRGQISPVFRLGTEYAIVQVITLAEEAWMSERNAGLQHVREQLYAEATERFEAAVESAEQFGPEDLRLATSLNDLAEVRRIRGDGAGAVPLYRRALAIWEAVLGANHPDIATALNNLAETYRSEGNHADAEPLYRRSVGIWEQTLGPDHANVATGLNNLALVLHADRQLEEAERLFRRALAIWEQSLGSATPNVATVLHNLADVLRSQGTYAEAEPVARRSLAILEDLLGPNHHELIESLDSVGELGWIQEDYAEAVLFYERSLGIRWGQSPGNGDLTDLLEDLMDLVALGFVRTPGFEEAFSSLTEEVEGFAADPDLPVAIGGILLSAGFDDQGKSILVRATERFPDSWLAHFRLGELYIDSGQYRQALDQFHTALESAASARARHLILMRMGGVHRDLDELDESLTAYQGAAGFSPDDPVATIALGLLYARRDRPGDALAAFDRASRMDPASVEAHYRLADSYLRLDRLGEAVGAAEKAVSLDPTHRQAHYLLGRALIQTDRGDDGQLALGEYVRLESEKRARENRVLESVRVQTEALDALAAGDAAAALELLRNGIDLYPEANRLYLALGLIQIRIGQHGAAIETLLTLAEEGLGDDSVVHRKLAGAYAALGDTTSSQRHTARYLQRIRTELNAQLPR
jgi:tetratricopeptide (TPR) repeat protein